MVAIGRVAAASAEIDPSYSPGGANMHPISYMVPLGPYASLQVPCPSQTAYFLYICAVSYSHVR